VKKIIVAAICLAVPGLLFLNAWQGYRYNELADQVAALEKQQAATLDANRDVIAQIAYESSAERVEQKAAGLGLMPVDPRSLTRVQVETPKRGGTGQ
jgi:ABC-type phosphate transport system auxiliary subunit